jgi:hypothetical protein
MQWQVALINFEEHMYTDSQCKEILKYLDTARIEDLHTPDMPELNLPAWLPSEVNKVITHYVEMASGVKSQKMRLLIDIWPSYVKYVTRILPAFTDLFLEPIWVALHTESKEKTVDLARVLIHMENDFEGAVSMFMKHTARCEVWFSCFTAVALRSHRS